jgi:L-threonylcarbamoyladenylate synthase
VRVLSTERLAKRLSQGRPDRVAVYARADVTSMAGDDLVRADGDALLRRMPSEAGAAAHELFAVLRALDAAGAREIWIEAPPEAPAWEGVRDRLSRAAASAGD